MKILVDMNLSPGWVEFLAGAGIEAIHWSSAGAHDAPDRDVMQWAAERDYTLLTADLDFGTILAAQRRSRPSVVQVRAENLAASVVGDIVVSAMQLARAEIDRGAIVSIDPTRSRVRLLPLDD
jgi:predicted nuclease of predicted toxin-antitoxin system